MTTYNERLNDLATEFAIAECARVGVTIGDTSMVDVINNFKPLAAIALKHMAEEFRRGYDYKYDGSDYEDLEERLITNGLIEPQTT